MIEAVSDHIFQIGVPLPGSPLKMTNAYLIQGNTRHLLVDNGFNAPASEEALLAGLAELGVRPQDLDLFLTHMHADHCGLTAKLVELGAGKVWFNATDAGYVARMVNDPEYWDETFGVMLLHGFTHEQMVTLRQDHPAVKHAMPRCVPFTLTREGEIIEVGSRRLRVVDLPGHTPGHMGLYDPEDGLLFSGDHILGRITPNITRWPTERDSLGRYLHSLAHTETMYLRLILPGHRHLVTEPGTRIAELRQHHARRLDEVRGILRQGGAMTAYTVASQMHWDIRYDSWDVFPVPQRWFACGEALSHLDHLAALGEVKQCLDQKRLHHFLA